VLLSKADRALGRLDGTASVLPNPDLFLAMYVRKEAVLSSQIEGTQASLIDVLDYEATGEMIKDVDEIVNCVRAMNKGLERLKELPLSLRLIKEIHEELLQGVRGEHRSPGEFRRTQNWVGPQGSTIHDALFIPPPPQEVLRLMGDLETFMHKKTQLPYLIKNALIHAQFETIHPFLDGNGRIGRLLITFLLVHDEILHKPLLYLSYHFKKNRTEYYDQLSNVRSNGDWEGWITFFLKGVFEVSQQATETGRKIIQLQERDRGKLSNNTNGLKLLDYLFVLPYVTIHDICKVTGISASTAGRLVKELINYGILRETTGYSRNRKFIYDDYYNLLKQGIEST
jgi:Fic family protein